MIYVLCVLSPAMAYRTKTPVSTLQVLLVQNSIFYYFLNSWKIIFCTSGSLKLKDLYFKVYKQEISGFHLLEPTHVHEHD